MTSAVGSAGDANLLAVCMMKTGWESKDLQY